jgi:predicted nucleotidyltransferase
MVNARTVQERIEANRDEIYRLAELYRTTNPRIFGSVARGESGPDSDVDILVDALPNTSLFDLGGLQSDLEDLFVGVRVDLLTPGDLPEKFRDKVIAEAKPI